MANRNKRIKKEEDDQVQNTGGMVVDTYTSQLPELVIFQILSLLSTKHAVRTSILSKEWARLCSSVLLLEFDEDEGEKQCADDHRIRRRMFLKFLSKCLKLREKHTYLDKFRLRMSYFGGGCAINKSLRFALERNVKELDICFIKRENDVRRWRYYYLPQTALNNANSLTTLKLENMKIKEDSIDPIRLPSLKMMSLKAVSFMTNTGFSRLLSGCPSIEYLSLTSCHGWDVRLSSSRLKYLEIMCCEIKLGVEETNLESFKFRGDNGLRHHIVDTRENFYIASCQTLRNLEFFHTHFAGRWFEGLNSRFPLLERLVLNTCSSYSGRINIFSQNLKRFVFCDCGNIMSNFSMNAPNLSEATITIQGYNQTYQLRNFLGNFGCSNKIRLRVTDTAICIFPEEMRKERSPPLPRLKHLEVEADTFTTAVTHSALMDSLRWMAPSLEFLSINRIHYIY